MSKRNFATFLLTATQSSNRLRNVSTVSSTCSQTETSSLSVMNVSVARVFFKPSVIGKEASGMRDFFFPERHEVCDVDIRVNFYANVVLSRSTTMFQEIGECMSKATDSVGSIHDPSFCWSGLPKSRIAQ